MVFILRRPSGPVNQLRPIRPPPGAHFTERIVLIRVLQPLSFDFGWANRSLGDEQRSAVKRNSVRLARLGPKRAKVAAIPVRERRYRPALLTTRGGTNDLTWRQGGVASQVVVHQVKRLDQIIVQRNKLVAKIGKCVETVEVVRVRDLVVMNSAAIAILQLAERVVRPRAVVRRDQ